MCDDPLLHCQFWKLCTLLRLNYLYLNDYLLQIWKIDNFLSVTIWISWLIFFSQVHMYTMPDDLQRFHTLTQPHDAVSHGSATTNQQYRLHPTTVHKRPFSPILPRSHASIVHRISRVTPTTDLVGYLPEVDAWRYEHAVTIITIPLSSSAAACAYLYFPVPGSIP